MAKRSIQTRLARIAGFLLVLLCLPGYVNAQEEATKYPFVVGKVSHNPRKHYGYLKPLADYLAKEMQDLGFTHGEVLMAANNQQLIDYLTQGKVDLVNETAFSAMEFHEKAGAEPIARQWKKGVASYYSIIFIHRNSSIQSLQDLQGKIIEFEDPGSTSAFYLPAAALLKAGLKLQYLESPRQQPDTDKVGYVFSREEINTSIWVHKGLVAAGAFNNLDCGKSDHMPPELHAEY